MALSGLIGAVALLHPEHSVAALSLKSVKKKYKNAKFAAGCSRELIERTIRAMSRLQTAE